MVVLNEPLGIRCTMYIVFKEYGLQKLQKVNNLSKPKGDSFVVVNIL